MIRLGRWRIGYIQRRYWSWSKYYAQTYIGWDRGIFYFRYIRKGYKCPTQKH